MHTKENWLKQLKKVITDPEKLIKILKLDINKKKLSSGFIAKKSFPLRVPYSFVKRMKKGDSKDPLFLQIFTNVKEINNSYSNYIKNPLQENKYIVTPGLIHKYRNRVLLITKSNCAINCRYCFRRHFPYINHQGNKKNWMKAIKYIKENKEIDEVILSGGDPLIAKDKELKWLINEFEDLSNIKRLRIHSRLIVVIPQRITKNFCLLLKNTKLKIIIVTHINHAQELNNDFIKNIKKLKKIEVSLLNQSVLLKGINDNACILADLSRKLFDNGIIPYYLHVLDKVDGASHFSISYNKSKLIFNKLSNLISGYMLPKLVIDIPGRLSKKIIQN